LVSFQQRGRLDWIKRQSSANWNHTAEPSGSRQHAFEIRRGRQAEFAEATLDDGDERLAQALSLPCSAAAVEGRWAWFAFD
jgi:hypothetical protein